MEDVFKPGDLLILTGAFDAYIRFKNPTNTSIVFTNRLAKLEDIIDWDSPTGKNIKQARIKTGKWDNLPLEDCKFIVSIYYPEKIGRKGEKGVIARGVPLFHLHPDTKEPFFIKTPDWLYREIMKKCETFTVEMKDNVP